MTTEMTQLTLHLTGPFTVSDADGRMLDGLSRRGRAVLAVLACQPDMRAERGLLADLLWSDRGEAQARASLRQELAQLRRRLPTGLIGADRQGVWLEPDMVHIDTERPGAFMEGFDLPSEGFEDWLRSQRRPWEEERSTTAAAPAARTARPALALLPFEALGPAGDDMLAEGVVEEVTGALSRAHAFHVIARQSAFALRGAGLDLPAAAHRLGADYVVEGSVRRTGERVRVFVRLADGGDGRMLWSARFDDHLDDLFDLQDRIAARIAGQIAPSLRGAEIARAQRLPSASRTAYSLTLSALPHFWAHRREENARAIALFDRALEHTPDYIPALAYKAWAMAQQPSYMWSDEPEADRLIALALAERAARGVGEDAPSLVALSAVHSMCSRDTVPAQRFVERALAVDPNNAWGWMRRGWVAIYEGTPERALEAFEHAEQLSPLDPFLFNVRIGQATALGRMGEHRRAAGILDETILFWPGVEWAYRSLARIRSRAGDMAGARAAIDRLLAAYPGLTAARIRACMPPSIADRDPSYIPALVAAGLPEG